MLSLEQSPGSDVLELVNKARLVLELPPIRRLPKGIPDTARKCVLGRSLGLEILLDDQDRAYALLTDYRLASKLASVWGAARPCGMWNGWGVMLPAKLSDFVREFDSRCYPRLVSPHRESKSTTQSELRHLRFDWADQHARVSDLLKRARSAWQNAERALNNSLDRELAMAVDSASHGSGDGAEDPDPRRLAGDTLAAQRKG